MKLPAFQFYPGDWRKDPGVQSLDYHDRGVWFEILCLMHESEDRGKLLLNGKPMPEDALARLLGLDKQILTTTLTTILTYGIASRCEDTGAIICRRMVRDENIRQIRTEAGKKGGNPVLLKQKPTTGVKQKPTPSSSSSSSVSSSEEIPPNPQGGFDLEIQESANPSKNQNTPLMIRIGKITNPNRRDSTKWDQDELKAFKAIDFTEDEISLVEDFYRFTERDREPLFRRTSLVTLLRHWNGEVAKANAWAAKYGRTRIRNANHTGK